ncbi:MAG: glycosyltransferase family 2 protein [Opitutales bacterium]
MPVVSVITPFHRVTPYLRPMVASVLAQTMGDLELLLVDNGTGTGLSTLGELAGDPRIRLLSSPANEGASLARNRAVAEARGDYIAVLDYDDLARPARLEQQVACLRADPQLGLVSSQVESIDGTGQGVGREFALQPGRAQYDFSGYSMPAPISSYTGRRGVFARYPFRAIFDFAEDYDFLSRAAEAWPLGAVPGVLLEYRVHDGQTTRLGNCTQVLLASYVRLLTARRRAGRPEALPELMGELRRGRLEPPPLAATYADFARRCLAEHFPLLAVYHARKLLSVRRDRSALGTALGVLAGALRQEPRAAVTLTRMFFTGPLRTHGLRPG